MTVTFRNTSRSACLDGGLGYSLERRGDDGRWGPAGFRGIFPAMLVTLAPGESSSVSFTADDGSFDDAEGAFPLQPGRYRMVQSWRPDYDPREVVSASWEFGLKLDAASRCGKPARAADVRLTASTGPLTLLRIVNDGGVCAQVPASIALERVLGDGSTEPVGAVTTSPCSITTVTPGRAIGYGFFGPAVAPQLDPGSYRATATATAAPLAGPDQALPLTVDFELTETIPGGPGPIVDCVPPPWL